MHGKGQRESEVCRRLICGQHMPVTTTTTVDVRDSSVVSTVTDDSFCKQDKELLLLVSSYVRGAQESFRNSCFLFWQIALPKNFISALEDIGPNLKSTVDANC